MQVVLDPYDPTGMFSKAGRISQEMYQMIQKKEEILNFQPVFHRRKKNSLSIFNIVIINSDIFYIICKRKV